MTILNIEMEIAENAFFNNGEIILNYLEETDSLKSKMEAVLNAPYSVKEKIHKEKGKDPYGGPNATDLNSKIREKMNDEIENINFETHVENGIFYHNKKEGFDFSFYDKEDNRKRLYNYYMGSKGVLNGHQKIIEINKKVGETKKDWRKIVSDLGLIAGEENEDIITSRKQLTTVGEIQFGNWALTYKDLVRLLNAMHNPGIDFYIYIAATGRLKDFISSATVNYDKTIRIINENKDLIKVPAWIIGIDYK